VDDFLNNEQQNFNSQGSSMYPPKPMIVERKQNALLRSLISLGIYGVLFYALFNQPVVYIAAILVVIIIHEMGHFLAMKLFDYSNVKIFIVPLLGAFTSGKKQNVSQTHLSFIILAGPIPGIIIGTVLYFINRDLQNETIKMLSNVFLVINLLNCLPFYPLDGGRLIETLFFKQNFAVRIAFGIISIMGLIVLCFLLQSPLMLVIPVFIGIELFNESKHQKIRDYLKQEHINYFTDYPALPDKDYWLIRDCLLFSFPKKYISVKPGVYQYSIIEPILIKHITSILQVNLTYNLTVLKQILLLLFYLASFLIPIIYFGMQLK
jgi:stage IV sporulation protein FB